MKRATHFYGLSIMDFAVIGITHFYKSIFLVDFFNSKVHGLQLIDSK